MKKAWIQDGSYFYPGEVSSIVPKLPDGVYQIKEHPATKDISLLRVKDNFEFGYNVYGIEEKFIKRVVRSYEETAGNMGILLNGIKGTGKTVTAKKICNAMGMPVIMVDAPYVKLVEFLSELQQDVCVFVDEYEKIYKDSTAILTVMDGISSGTNRRLFLLTTNDSFINSNMLQRPGRLRYVKEFSNLSPEVIEEIIGDTLKYPEFKMDIIKAVSQLNIITIDLVKAIIQEVNIHNESPTEFMDVFNVRGRDYDNINIEYHKLNPDGTMEKEVLFLGRGQGDPKALRIGTYIWGTDSQYNGRIMKQLAPSCYEVTRVFTKDDDMDEDSAKKLKPGTFRIVDGEYYTLDSDGEHVEGAIVERIQVKAVQEVSTHYSYGTYYNRAGTVASMASETFAM